MDYGLVLFTSDRGITALTSRVRLPPCGDAGVVDPGRSSSQIIRLVVLTVIKSSTDRSTGDAENGFFAAILVNGANSSPIACR